MGTTFQPSCSAQVYYLTNFAIPWSITVGPCQKLVPLLFISSFQVQEGCNGVSPDPSLLQTEETQLPQPFFIGEVLTTNAPKKHLRSSKDAPFFVLQPLGIADYPKHCVPLLV